MVACPSLLRPPCRRRSCTVLLAVAACVALVPSGSSSFSFGVVVRGGPPSSSPAVRQQRWRNQPRGTGAGAGRPGRVLLLPVVPPQNGARVVVRLSASRRYGPPPGETTTSPPTSGSGGPEDPAISSREEFTQQQQRQNQHRDVFRRLLDRIASASDPSHVPSLLTRHMDTILSVLGEHNEVDDNNSTARWLESLIHDAHVQYGEAEGLRMAEALESVVQCAEEFVSQAKSMEEEYQALLGRILRLASDRTSVPVSIDREDSMDRLFDESRESLTPGFLRHLERECDRIAAAPILTPDSARLSELLCVVRARIVEELGRHLGEVAQLLGSLVSCDDRSERKALVDAAVAVRGSAFARDLASAADEALEGFGAAVNASAGDGVDPDLIQRVQEIRDRVRYHHP